MLQKRTLFIKNLKLEGDISKMSSVDELPKECLDYIKFIEEFTNVRVSMISVGPDRVNNIYVHDIK